LAMPSMKSALAMVMVRDYRASCAVIAQRVPAALAPDGGGA
jgi:hypothetical protein